ncbi:DUF3343 domain-containing protein [Irregularibacter muris]|uniref:DUF3343 domain-containing protein n=1 Tax=Irregularibacter muris TaxID=1796619 RepID=A0AAE3KZI0_9FIRM|nr:DUF3343 domain-containing protein [Irregularibacter muris]MCR1899265.1 DUF3343 domain-containing protein [Irregularibacter muris]
MTDNYYIIAFNSTHHAISTEQALKEAQKKIMMIPTPREITSSCGLSLQIQEKDIPFAQETLKNKNLSYYGIFKVKVEQGKKSIEKIVEQGDGH